MAIKPFILKEMNWKQVQNTRFEIAVLPWGATEAHNYHLPYGTDIYESEAIAAEAARIAWEQGARVVVLPAIPFGANCQQLDIPMTINMNPTTQAAVLQDVIASLEPHSVKKLVILNGHGGNDFKNIIRQAQVDSDLFLCQLHWFRVPVAENIFDQPGDHADEIETSLMLHLYPRLVLPLAEAGDGAAKRFKVRALNQDWAWAPRRWTQVTRDTGVGDPRQANAEKGAQFFRLVTQEIATFLTELQTVQPDALYE